MNTATLPRNYTPPVWVNNRALLTCAGIYIGGAIAPQMPEITLDCARVQAALLDRRAPARLKFLNRIAAALWRWC